MYSIRSARWGALCAAVALAACSTTNDKPASGSSAPEPARRATAETPRARPAPVPPTASTPTPSPAPPATPAHTPSPAPTAPADAAPASDQAVYAEGLRLYRAGRYDAALERFDAVHSPPALRLQALKYSAFSHCVNNRLPPCQRAFEQALRLSPGFRLSAAEQGHPVWGPVFTKVLRASGAAEPARRAPARR